MSITQASKLFSCWLTPKSANLWSKCLFSKSVEYLLYSLIVRVVAGAILTFFIFEFFREAQCPLRSDVVECRWWGFGKKEKSKYKIISFHELIKLSRECVGVSQLFSFSILLFVVSRCILKKIYHCVLSWAESKNELDCLLSFFIIPQSRLLGYSCCCCCDDFCSVCMQNSLELFFLSLRWPVALAGDDVDSGDGGDGKSQLVDLIWIRWDERVYAIAYFWVHSLAFLL